MPNLDQTGPMGKGPMTGQRNGRCTHYGAALKEETKEMLFSGDFYGRGKGRRCDGSGRARVKRLAGRGRGQACQNRHGWND